MSNHIDRPLPSCYPFFLPAIRQLTNTIPKETMGSPTINETVNSSLMKRTPNRTPKMGAKKVNADSRLTGYSWISLNQTK